MTTIDRDQTFTLGELMDAMSIEECRVTGMHDPTHTTRHFCQIQQAGAFGTLMKHLGIEMEDLPRHLSQWTHRDIREETGDRKDYSITRVREKHRDLLAWEAGAPMELFRPAADVVTEEKTEMLLSVLTDKFEPWQNVTRAMHERYPDFRFPQEWYNATRVALVERGVIEQRDISIRLAPKPAEVSA